MAGFQFHISKPVKLASNGTITRGTNFDAVDVIDAGILSIQTDMSSNLIFYGAGSAWDFSDPFWTSNH